jgi:AbrB family looped-hinge helix DNA binding protein
MKTVTVSDKGQVVIPAEIRRDLGITPGCQLDFSLHGDTIQAVVRRRVTPSRAEEGYGLLVCRRPGTRRLSDFDVAAAMRQRATDEGT